MNIPLTSIPEDSSGSDDARLQRFTHEAMACTFTVGILAGHAGYAASAARAAFAEVDRLEQILSRFVPHSDIAQINRLRPGESVRVHIETVECLQLASQVHAQTGGAFDLAFRSVRPAPPDSSERRAAPLVFDSLNRAVGVAVEGLVLDLGGLGKGYAVDRAVAVLREWSIEAALVDSGQSTVFALGQPRGAPAWRVGLRRPDRHDAELGSIELHDYALGGSGQLLHGQHIIDPRTGQPAEATAAWAVAPTAALADAFSTAFMILTPAEAEAICERRGDISAIVCGPANRDAKVVCLGPHAGLFRSLSGTA